jgi:16S rRNA (cytosine967-C5)-methyltransferase
MTDKPRKPRSGQRRTGKASPKPAAVRPPDARNVALAMLGRIIHQKQTLDEALSQSFATGAPAASLETRDRGFARLLVTTVLRRRGQIDDILGHCLSKPLSETQPKLLNILRLGAAQILFLETAPHAAVDATVRLAGKHASQRGLINAILRRLDREGRDWVVQQESENLAGRLNTPEWLWDSWCAAWGEEATQSVAACHMQEPALDLTLKPGASDDSQQADLDAVALPGGSLRRLAGGRIEDLPGYTSGTWWIQDAAATLPARLLLNILDTADLSGPVIDLCAAPGGKTAQLAAAGRDVTAVDMSSKRLQRLSENLDRLKLAADVIKADARKWRPKAPPAGVLLDAPCSATGTIRRHPDAAWSKSPAEVDRLVKIQTALINAAVEMLPSEGVLIFCTCSLQPEEGEAQAAALRARADLVHLPVNADEAPGFEAAITAEGDVRILPGHIAARVEGEISVPGGNDGFFITRLQKK